MIAKGNTHDNGVRLARYLTAGKAGEYAALWELRGFAPRDIVDAFRSVHVMAAAGQCRQPFFHVQVRNPEGEKLTRAQWHLAVDKIETMVGLADQPRAIAVHRDQKTGHEHIHIAWSRIDSETLSARALPFFKLRLKKISRELEEYFGLTTVPDYRNSPIAYAPKRAEEQQARRLGVVIDDVREAIKTAFENSDCGRSFRSALLAQGMHLAKGERRDFIVIDREGGLHAVGKRILGTTAAEIRVRLGDLHDNELPSVDQVRAKAREKRLVAASKPSLIDALALQSSGADSAGQKIVKPRGRQGRAAGKENRVSPAQTESAELDEVKGGLSHGEARVVGNVEIVPPRLVQPLEAARSVATLEPAPEPALPRVRSTVGEILKKQFRVLVRAVTSRGPNPTPKSRRRREETGGFFKATAVSLFRWFERGPLEASTPAWEPFTWLHIWDHNNPTTMVDFQRDSNGAPSSDHSLNL